jgi:hypothetical protein
VKLGLSSGDGRQGGMTHPWAVAFLVEMHVMHLFRASSPNVVLVGMVEPAQEMVQESARCRRVSISAGGRLLHFVGRLHAWGNGGQGLTSETCVEVGVSLVLLRIREDLALPRVVGKAREARGGSIGRVVNLIAHAAQRGAWCVCVCVCVSERETSMAR